MQELSLNLCDRINKVPKDAKPDVKAKCDDYITWEELFMGLALLEHVYSNDGDTKPTVKVYTHVSILDKNMSQQYNSVTRVSITVEKIKENEVYH